MKLELSKRAFLTGAGAALVSTAAPARDGGYILHRCGVVEMQMSPSGEVEIHGWQDIVPNEAPAIAPRGNPRFVITSSFVDKVVEVHERTADGTWGPRAIWPVVTPDPSELPGVVGGKVYRIDTEPDWNPSPQLRQKYARYREEHPEEDLPPLPRGTIPYGHVANPMGQRKIRANWGGRYPLSAVLHGTTGYPVELCGAETSGCVRIFNDWIVELVDNILGSADPALAGGVECILTPERIVGSASVQASLPT